VNRNPVLARIARLRVPLGFVSGAFAVAFARPTPRSLILGGALAVAGELVRVWAAGHIEKGREVTRSGPYRFVRHPLYAGSAIMAAGFTVAARSWVSSVVVAVYVIITFTSAIRTEEAALDERFDGEYSKYRSGQAPPIMRRFSAGRVVANREHRSIAGLVIGLALLYGRSLLP
jgi:protein-S-isoprenylcysteine O-methyltransferase Ste14